MKGKNKRKWQNKTDTI